MPFFSRFLDSDRRRQAEAASWHPVDSSNVKAFCWRDESYGERHGLGIWFAPKKKDGTPSGPEVVYWYSRLTYKDYVSALNASSPGGWVSYFIRKKNEPFLGPFTPPG